jgi:hypothetical protein
MGKYYNKREGRYERVDYPDFAAEMDARDEKKCGIPVRTVSARWLRGLRNMGAMNGVTIGSAFPNSYCSKKDKKDELTPIEEQMDGRDHKAYTLNGIRFGKGNIKEEE